MEINELIYRMSLTKCVSNKLILKACRQFIASQNNANLTLQYIKESLKNNKQESFMNKFWKPIEKRQDFITFLIQFIQTNCGKSIIHQLFCIMPVI